MFDELYKRIDRIEATSDEILDFKAYFEAKDQAKNSMLVSMGRGSVSYSSSIATSNTHTPLNKVPSGVLKSNTLSFDSRSKCLPRFYCQE
jgi:hypothetical protein